MANKPKLIYLNGPSNTLTNILTWIRDNGSTLQNPYDWNNQSNDFYRSIVFSEAGYIITHGKVFSGINHKLTLNGTDNGDSSGTSLGSFYAPITAGTSGYFLKSNGDNSSPTWVGLVLDLSTAQTGSIPDAKAVYDLITSVNAMVYCGTIAGGSYTPSANRGDTYVVSSDGNIDGEPCSAGDMLICNTDGTAQATSSNQSTIVSKWDFIHTNMSTALTVANLGGTSNALKRAVYKDSNLLYVDLLFRPVAINGTTISALDSNQASVLNLLTIQNNGISITERQNQTTNAYEGIQFELLTATSSILGGVKPLSSVYGFAGLWTGTGNVSTTTYATTGTSANPRKYINKITTTTGKFYAVVTDEAGRMFVNVPWSNDNDNTWRPIYAYSTNNEASEIRSGSIGTDALSFGPDFIASDPSNDTYQSGSEIHLAWAEVSADGTTITYAV